MQTNVPSGEGAIRRYVLSNVREIENFFKFF